MNVRSPRVWLPILVLIASGGVAWFLITHGPRPEPVDVSAEPLFVRAVEAQPESVQIFVRSQGSVRPATETTLAAEVGGEIVRARLEPGSFFEGGDMLVEIDPTDYRLAVIVAEGDLAQSQLALERAKQEAEVARQEWEQLGEGEPTPLALHIPQLAQARAAVKAAGARLDRAKVDLERTTVRAPYPGRVRQRRADVGQFVSPGAPLADVYSTEYAEVTLPIPTEDAAFIDLPLALFLGGPEAPGESTGEIGEDGVPLGPRVSLTAEFAGRRYEWPARIVRTAGEIDPQTRVIQAVARVDDPYGRRAPNRGRPPLLVGLFVRARIFGRTLPGAYSLPRAALRGKDTVYVVNGRDRLEFRQVEVVHRARDRVVIREGLRPGERVVISPMEAPVEGMPLRVTVEPTPRHDSSDMEVVTP